MASKYDTLEFRATLKKMASKLINEYSFISYRTPDNKHFFLIPTSFHVNQICFGENLKSYEISYVLLGQHDMVK